MRVRFRVQLTGGVVQLSGGEFFRDNIVFLCIPHSAIAVPAR
jgi:hypothetical protein